METDRQRSGRMAEEAVLAAAHIRGLKVIEKNYHTRYGELDLVLTDNVTLIVVEVRYRSHDHFGSAVETVNRPKQRKIIAATKGFLVAHTQWHDAPIRFDVVGVNSSGDLDWIEQAFLGE